MKHTVICVLIAVVTISFCLGGCHSHQPLLQPSRSSPATYGVLEPDFNRYVSNSRERIRAALYEASAVSGNSPYVGGYSLSEAVLMRAPFQIPEDERDVCVDPTQGAGKVFLLIHGLSDSPYLMRSMAVSLHNAYPCAVIRAVLLPGHGTVPGDMLNVKYEQWLHVTDYGVKSFEKDDKMRELYLVGFSAGASLALRQVKESSRVGKVKGVVLLSPALKAKNPLVRFAGFISLLTDWESIYAERDAARYESFSYNTAAEFYRLTSDVLDGGYELNVPVLMAVSADDATIDAVAARSFFCHLAHSKRRALIWYRSRYSEDGDVAVCADIAAIEITGTGQQYSGIPYRTVSLSHIAVPVSPADRHYGVSGRYRNCKSYDGNDNPDDFAKCQNGSSQSVFGENGIGTVPAKQAIGYDYWRRGTFNPDYERLEKSVICFVDNSCNLSNVLELSR